MILPKRLLLPKHTSDGVSLGLDPSIYVFSCTHHDCYPAISLELRQLAHQYPHTHHLRSWKQQQQQQQPFVAHGFA